jgi:hypothetical protein
MDILIRRYNRQIISFGGGDKQTIKGVAVDQREFEQTFHMLLLNPDDFKFIIDHKLMKLRKPAYDVQLSNVDFYGDFP